MRRHRRDRTRRPVPPRPSLILTAVVAGALGLTLTTPVAGQAATTGAPRTRTALAPAGSAASTTWQLPSPPRPPSGRPVVPSPSKATTGSARSAARAASPTAATPATPATAKSFGPSSTTSTLVLYDTSGTWGWLGEEYALAAGTLATHFGEVTAEPATDYVSGQINDYTATIYVGSTYNEALPASLLTDVTTTTKPVIWAGFNIWQVSGAAGSATDTAFQAKYGWDPATSYLDATDTLATVTYKGRSLSRSTLNTGGVLAPHITTASAVSVLAQANCTTSSGTSAACAPIAQTTGSTLPWAIRSSNLTYVGEIPFAYLSESDRYLAFADLLYPALAPTATGGKKALVRLEDVDPTTDPTLLRQFVDYLAGQNVPFSIGVIPEYRDPKGTYNSGVAKTVTLAQSPTLVSALTYAQTKGGTIIEHGYTHQYSDVANPYDGVTGDDFEFFTAQCSTTATAPYQYQVCADSSWVIQQGAVPGDSALWAGSRLVGGRTGFLLAGLSQPTIFETPHYAASAVDYQAFRTYFATRYERELFFGGLLSGPGTSANVFGQFFPYSVTDIYGSKIIPENLGNYEPVALNNHPARTSADIIANATANQVVTQSVASFFFHPTYPLSELQATVTGIKALGYTFVAPADIG
jgi:uncharacterized protein YdaL